MKKIFLKINTILDVGLKDYLLGVDGINDILLKEDTITIKYDNNIISLKVVVKEALLYLSLLNIPSIMLFDKYEKSNNNYKLIIKDLCCEYCLYSLVEELMYYEGIVKINTNFDFHNKKNVELYILYDDKVIPEKKLIKIENKINK